jgi:hypothetical protein
VDMSQVPANTGFATQVRTQLVKLSESMNVDSMLAKLPIFLNQNLATAFADLKAFDDAFQRFILAGAKGEKGASVVHAAPAPVAISANDKTKGTRFANFESRYNTFAATLKTDKVAIDLLTAKNIHLEPKEWNALIGIFHNRLAKNDCEQHATYEAYRGHFAASAQSNLLYHLKGQQIEKAKAKQEAVKKKELRTGKGGKNPYFNRMRKKILNPKPEKTFAEWQMWCVELLASPDFRTMSETDKVWFGQLEGCSKRGQMKAVFDGVKAGLNLSEIVEQL